MKKHNGWIYEFIFVVLCVMTVLALFIMMRKAISVSGDMKIQKIIDATQEHLEKSPAALPKITVTSPERTREAVMILAPSKVEPKDADGNEETEKPEESAPCEDWFIDTIPLDKDLQDVVWNACGEYGVDYYTVLGLIQVESNFQTDAVNTKTGCYGLMQLNPMYFLSGLTPQENVEAGMEYLGRLLDRYRGDVDAALTAYNAGHDTGRRWYANAVRSAAEDIMWESGVYTD